MFSRQHYDAAHHSAVTLDGAMQGTIAMTGADRAAFLHALLTNDIAALKPGSGAYSAYLTPQGRMISDMRVIETGHRVLLGVDRSVAAALAERLDTLIFSEDAQVRDLTGELEVIGVHGPSAAAMIQRATGVSVIALENQYDNLTSGGLTIVRDDALALPGFDIYAPSEAAGSVRASLAESGAAGASAETFDVLRIEAARPRFGVDMTTDTIPLEAGLERRAISFTKGCYVGQEVIVRVMHRGHGRVARRLVTILLPDGSVPARGDKVLSGDRPVGEITSAAGSPKMNAGLAIGYVQREHAAPGTELAVNGSPARVYQTVD